MAIQSVQRAVALLKAFEGGIPQLGVTELSQKVNLHKSTVSRLLATLEHDGLVKRVPETDKYRLGFALVRLAAHVPHFGDLRAVAHPYLNGLAEATRETATLAVLYGIAAIYVKQVSGHHLVRYTNWVGQRTPLHDTAIGKALLAFQAEAIIEHATGRWLSEITNQAIYRSVPFVRRTGSVRARGYAVAIGEFEEGLNSVAAPISDAASAVVAAVSASGPAYRMTPERVSEFGALTIDTAAKISARLGNTTS